MSYFEPFADDLVLGTPLPSAPAITIDEGLTWQYQAIAGDALRPALSRPLAERITGSALVNPALVLQVAIGQSTVATRRVIANLFYRDVRLLQQVTIGTTLRTVVTPVAAQLARPGANGDRAKVLLSITTRDQDDNVVADFERLALIPVRDAAAFQSAGETGTADSDTSLDRFAAVAPSGWDLTELAGGLLAQPGTAHADPLAEPVTDALALVRITQNLAAAHRDAGRGQRGKRLVYGGHTIALAQAALTRFDSGIATVLGWIGCDHLAPVFEDDLLSFTVQLADVLPQPHGNVVSYQVTATTDRDGETVTVLAWRPVVLTASEPNPTEGI